MSTTTHGPLGPNTTAIFADAAIIIDLDVWEGAYGKDETRTEIGAFVIDYLNELIAGDFEARGLTTKSHVTLRVQS